MDFQYAFKMFYGKSNAEMQPAFARCVIERADELRWMPPKPFQYYMQGFADFVLDGNYAKDDAPEVASCFLRLVAEKLDKQTSIIAPIMPTIMPVVKHIGTHQRYYHVDIDIYGNFAEKAKIIEQLWQDKMMLLLKDNK